LGCSYLELDAREDKAELMEIAFTIQQGKTDGDYLLSRNKEYIKAVQEEQKEREALWK
jgi:hypothetical protein